MKNKIFEPAFLLLIILVSWSCYRQERSYASNSTYVVKESNLVTLSKYLSIRDSASYSDVVRIIGNNGEEISRSHSPAIPGVMNSIDTVMYQWVNSDGSNMNAIFQNDKLFSKAQFGLK